MALLPTAPSPPVEAIDRAYEKAALASTEARPFSRRLGASIIGRDCSRQLWYGFRWAGRSAPPGRVLRLFETGHLEEDRMADDLRKVGIEVHQVDQSTGEQFELVAVGGHFVCKLDGALIGVPEAPKAWHVWEAKTHNRRSFQKLVAVGVKGAKPEHFAQCQVGMHLAGMKRALYLAKNKDDDDLYTERLCYERNVAEDLLVRAERIVSAQEPPPRVPEYPDGFSCRFCDYAALCRGEAVPLRVCRTCLHSTPERDGSWTCSVAAQTRSAVNGRSIHDYRADVFPLEYDEQLQGCRNHLYLPALVPGEIDSTDVLNIIYRVSGGLWTDGPSEAL